MDDELILGDEEQLTAALTKILSMAQLMGIEVNLVKCRLWGPAFAEGSEHLPDACPMKKVLVVKWGSGTGIKVLGIPVCCPDVGDGEHDRFAKSVWSERVAQAVRAMKILERFPESHVQYTLLRQCLAACKVNHLMRACPVAECAEMS